MSLHLHRAERTDLLADGLAALLATPAGDPFDEELVVVPAAGVERWLSQRLSHRLGARTARPAELPAAPGAPGDGVCAGVRFVSPRSLVAQLLDIVDDDPWAPTSVAWPLLSVIDGSLDEPWLATVSRHLGHGEDGDEAELRRGRRFAVASRLAHLFTSYAVQRPSLLVDWMRGESTDGAGGPLDPDLAWQPELWRRLVATVDAADPLTRQTETLRRLQAEPDSFDLPQRLSLFGHTRLPSTEIELLAGLAAHRDVHLWLPHPSEALWQAQSIALRAGEGGPPLTAQGAVARADDPSHLWTRNPLLTTLGRDSRELERALFSTTHDDTHLEDRHFEDRHLEERADSPGSDPTGTPAADGTLLRWLQSDVAANATRPDGRHLGAADRSVQIHACHGPARQVDVLREVLLGLLEADPTLEPRDILVMCPDIETYAPLITAGFGLGDVVPDGHPAHRLRVRLADRSLAQTNPLLGVASRLLQLAGGRAPASAILDLAQLEPVRRRFGFTDDDLVRLGEWVRESGVRWGFDAEHRAPFGLERFTQNTWQSGVDRVLTGVALSDDAQAWVATALPLDDVGSVSVDLAGRYAEFLSRVREVTDHLTGQRPLTAWVATLLGGLDLITQTSPDDAWQVGQARRELTRVMDDAADYGETSLRLPDARALLDAHLAGRPTRANFRTGTLTVCTMVPMRSVPHRVVCLLGIDDGVFPRHGIPDGDDVLARRPLTGERDPRSEDRQLLLDAVLAATETLVVTYTGANAHTGQPRPPAVPLGEVLDALDRTTEAPVRERVVIHHPLQPFDVRNLIPGRLGVDQAFTFDPTAVVAATAAAGTRPSAPGFVSGPLPAPSHQVDVGLDELLRFFRDPVKGFFAGLDLTLPWEVDRVSDAMPVALDALEQWGVGDRMLRDMLAGIHPDRALQAEWRRGTLPPGRLGWRDGLDVRESAMQLAIKGLTHRQVRPETIDVEVDLGNGRRLSGTVPRVYDRRLVSVGYSKLGAKQLLQAWIQLLALAASDPDHNYTALAIGRPPRGKNPAARLFAPPDDSSGELLADLVALRDAGLREPLPLPLKTSFAWASARLSGGQPMVEAERRWAPRNWDGDNAEPAHVRVWGARAPLSVLTTPVDPAEAVDDETTRLGSLAMRLWGPMLRFEQGSA